MAGILQSLLASIGGAPMQQLWSWGTNSSGETGLNDTENRSSPVQVGSLTDWQQAVRGNGFAFAIKTNGTLWSWGYQSASNGVLGLNDAHRRSSPVQVGALTNWKEVEPSNGTGSRTCIAIKKDGTLWIWGVNTNGALGVNDTANKSSPVQIGSLTSWKQASTGGSFSAAVKTDGTLWTWGNGAAGSLGLNLYGIFRSSPVQVGALTNWSQVSAGGGSDCAAIKTDGTLWSWGANDSGVLGLNTRQTNSGYPDYFVYNRVSSPTQVGSLTDWAFVSLKTNSCLAVKTDGTLWTWGKNDQGQLGLGNTAFRSSPVQVGALTTWDKGSIGEVNAAAIKTSGTIWLWGSGFQGQLGQNNTVDQSSPVQVGALSTWLSVSPGTIAIKKP